MRKTICYPFQGKQCSITEILKYYRDKGINVERSQLNAEIRKVTDIVGKKENITEEMFLNIIKKVVSRTRLSSVGKDFKSNCINEFGPEFWEYLTERRKRLDANRQFRLKMKKMGNFNNEKSGQIESYIDSVIESKNSEQQNAEERN